MHKSIGSHLLAASIALGAGVFVGTTSTPALTVCFSPRGGCEQAVVEEVGKAQRSVLVQAYSFTSAPIAEALVQAKARGVNVAVVLDRSDVAGASAAVADKLRAARITVYIDAKHAIAHNKVMVIDGKTVLTGSFNFTHQAEHANAENLLIVHSQPLAQRYAENWVSHADHSERYRKAKETP